MVFKDLAVGDKFRLLMLYIDGDRVYGKKLFIKLPLINYVIHDEENADSCSPRVFDALQYLKGFGTCVVHIHPDTPCQKLDDNFVFPEAL